jgi:hypothetical protein
VSVRGPGSPGSYDRRVLTSPSTLRLVLLTTLVVAVTALSSCGDEAHPRGAEAGQAIGQQLPRKAGPAAHLLADDKMPTAGSDWHDVDTSDSDEVLGPCHLSSLVDIGALSTARRTWNAAGSTPRAVQVVARFADNKSAWRAHEVLDSWQADCAGRVSGKVGARRVVTVATGAAEAYRVDQGDRATDLGIVRKGEYLSVVSLTAPSAQLPADSAATRAALKRIAATF